MKKKRLLCARPRTDREGSEGRLGFASPRSEREDSDGRLHPTIPKSYMKVLK